MPIKSREIAGYGRDCVECGKHNYHMDDKESYKCKPCSYGCDTCKEITGECLTCRNDYGNFPKCDCEFGMELDEGCFCNKKDHYIQLPEKLCLQCDECTRNEIGCKDECKSTHRYKPAMGKDVCCEPCHPSCNECSGTESTQCRPPVDHDETYKCNNDALFEQITGVLECYCVCHAVYTDGACVCEAHRVKEIDLSQPESHKYQCLCEPGYIEGNKDASGFTPCYLPEVDANAKESGRVFNTQ